MHAANTWAWLKWVDKYTLDNHFDVFTHERADNQDNQLFLEGGRQRNNPWIGEDFSNGFIAKHLFLVSTI